MKLKEVMAHALLTATALVGAAAQAQEGQIVAQGRSPKSVSTTVPFADLNLNAVTGVDQLKIRVRKAAQSVCKEIYDPKSVSEFWEEYHCIKTANRAAQPDIREAVERFGNGGVATHTAILKVSVASR
jgi:UrcA family protein